MVDNGPNKGSLVMEEFLMPLLQFHLLGDRNNNHPHDWAIVETIYNNNNNCRRGQKIQ